jgi:hypothetical protein
VIAVKYWIVIELKVLGHLIFVEKSEDKENIHLLLAIQKMCS